MGPCRRAPSVHVSAPRSVDAGYKCVHMTDEMRRDVPGGVGDDGAAREAPDGERRRRVTDGPEGDGDASGVAVAASGHDRGDAWGGASRGGEERPRGAAHREGDVSGEQHGTRSDAGGNGWARYPNPRCDCRHALRRQTAKHLPTCKQWEKNVCYGNRIRPECAPKHATRADARGFERPGACSCSSTTARAHPATRSTFPVVGIGAWSSSSSSSIFGNISAVETRRAWEKTANT